ncbi:MAG TPA: Gfo/Idh/MocA family oxidoreductase [Pirellulales bacterium]|nr:Gfo/Idh/MocA family oxidoreductase [Pirellulales bacterium]
MSSAVNQTIRVGIVGLGGNARLRHVGGLRACENVEIRAVCNRRPESTSAAAREFDIPKTYEHWQDLVADPELDAVLIGAWPYLHCPVTLAALEAGKHVLTEARMAMNAAEARRMFEASQEHPELVCQIVPSPFGFRAHRVVKRMIDSGFLGQLREVLATAANDNLADAALPLNWRQVRELSGLNMLTLGIVHETLMRWVPQPVRVFAQAQAFVQERFDPATGMRRRVGTPDSVHVLATLENGAHAIYHASGVTRFGAGTRIELYGSQGTLKYELAPQDRLWAARQGESELREVEVPADEALGWRVEAEFVDAIRGRGRIEFSDFAAGVRYMEFTEAVARSAVAGEPIGLPLDRD